MKDAHMPTKTPWYEGDDDENDQPTIYGEKDRFVTLCPHECVISLIEEAKANAALIVRCVNSHEALVDALEAAYALIQADYREVDESKGEYIEKNARQVWEKICAALALARHRGKGKAV